MSLSVPAAPIGRTVVTRRSENRRVDKAQACPPLRARSWIGGTALRAFTLPTAARCLLRLRLLVLVLLLHLDLAIAPGAAFAGALLAPLDRHGVVGHVLGDDRARADIGARAD